MRPWLIPIVAACTSPRAPAPPAPVPAAEPRIEIRRGRAITVDGQHAAGEWSDAGRLDLAVEPGWIVPVRYKHDGGALLFAFENLASPRGDAFRYPEVMLDATHDGGITIGTDDFWFHASFRDCWSRGAVNDYKSCTPELPAWSANNYSSQDAAPAVVEIRIPLALVEIPLAARDLGLAIDVTDTARAYNMWPAGAQLAVPSTWGVAALVP